VEGFAFAIEKEALMVRVSTLDTDSSRWLFHLFVRKLIVVACPC